MRNFRSLSFMIGSLLLAGCSASLNNPPTITQTLTYIRAATGVADGLTSSPVSIALVDEKNLPLIGVRPTFSATDTGATNVYGPCSVTDAAGLSSCTLISSTAESKVLTITFPITFQGSAVIFGPAPVSKITIASQPTNSAIAGISYATSPVFEVRDPFNNLVTNVGLNISISAYTDAACTVPGVGALSAASNPVLTVNGLATFSGVTYTIAGPTYLKASGPGLHSACTSVTTVYHNVANKLLITRQPSGSAVAGIPYTQQPIVTVEDFWGNLVNDGGTSTPPVTLSAWQDSACSAGIAGTLGASANPLTATAGVASFASVSHTKAAGIYLSASAPGLVGDCSTGTAVVPHIPNGAQSSITGTGPVAANSYHFSTISIAIRDQYGNPRMGDPIAFSATDTGATNIYGACPATDSNGFSTCTLKSSTVEPKTLSIISPLIVSGGTVNFIIPPTIAHSSIVASGPTVAGTNSTVTITLRDVANNPVIGIPPTFSATDTGGTNGYGNCTATDNSGIATCVFGSQKAELKTLAIIQPLAMTGSNVLFVHAVASQLQFSAVPASGTAGVNFTTQPVVRVYDQFLNFVNTGATATQSILLSPFTDSGCSTGGAGALNTSANPLASSAGVATFAGVNYTKAETLYLKATAGSLGSACSPAVPVINNVAHHLAFAVQPSSAVTAGTNFAQQPQVQVQDVFNNPIAVGPGNSAPITLAPFDSTCSAGVGGTLSASTNPLNASSGIASFSGVNYTLESTFKLRASGAGLSSICSTAIVVSPGSAVNSTITGTGPVTANGAASSNVTITLLDAYNNPLIGVVPTFAATDTGSTNVYGVCSSSSGAGVSTCTLKATKAELKTLQLLSPYSIPGGTVNFVAGPANKLGYFQSPTGLVTAGVPFSQDPIIQVLDFYGNLVTGAVNSITLSPYKTADCVTTPGTASLGAATNPLAASAGAAAFSGLTYPKVELLYLKASAAGLTAACSIQINMSPAGASSGNTSISASGPVTADGSSTSTVSIILRDAFGNALQGVVPGFSATGSSNTLGVCSAVSATGTSSCTLQSTFAENKTVALTSPIARAGNTVTFNPGPASKLTFTVPPSSSVAAGAVLAQSPSVQVQDAFGNSLNGAVSAITLSATTDASCLTAGLGTFTVAANPVAANGTTGTAAFSGVSYTKAETLYLKAASGPLNGCSGAITVNPAAPANLAFQTQPSSFGLIGKQIATPPGVKIQDTYGNLVVGAGNSIQLAPYTNSICTTLAPGTLSLSTNPLAASSGVASFSNLSYTNEAVIYLKASTAGVTSACSTSLELTRWNPMASANAPSARQNQSVVWTGSQMIIWGGQNGATYYNDGKIYDYASDTWSTIATDANTPSPRARHTAVWTGSEMIIWGGNDGSGQFNTGARYNLTTSSWSALPITGAPSGRTRHTAVWTGSQMIVFGGFTGSYVAGGGIYTVASNSWSTLAIPGMPAARADHTAVWTGLEMILFGGYDSVTYRGDGGRFNPSGAGTWSPLNTVGAPAGRAQQTAIYEGSSMIIWGGTNGATALDTGGVYDSGTFTWTSTNLVSAPSPRLEHTAVWTGTQMLIWGGNGGGPQLNTGALYTPGAGGGTWAATSVGTNLPIARDTQSAVWAMDRMLLFGGCTSGNCTGTTGTAFFYLP